MESKSSDANKERGKFMQILFGHTYKNIHSGDFGTVDDADVQDPWVPVDCVIKVINGQEQFMKTEDKDIKKNNLKIENEIKFLLRVRNHPNFVKIYDYTIEKIPLGKSNKENRMLEESGGTLTHLKASILMEKIKGLTLYQVYRSYIS